MKRTKYYVTPVLLLFCINLYGQYFKKLDMKDGLSNLSVLAIYQDTLGRMWFGTNEGVNIYDGERLSTYKSYEIIDNQLRKKKFINGVVDQIVGDFYGDVFLKTDGALIKYDIRKERFKEIYPTGISSIAVFDNEVWCAAGDSLFRYNAEADSLSFYQKLNTPTIWCMAKSGDKTWIGTAKGLYVLEGETVKCLLPEIEIFKLFVSSRNELWIASRMRGLYKIGRDGILKKEISASDRVVSEQIRSFVEDDQNNVWFGTFDGLQMYRPSTDTYCVYRPNFHPGSLSHESVFSLYKDRQGTIWVGTYYGGVNYFNLKKDLFKYYVYAEANNNCLNYPIIGQIIEDKRRDLWICTDGGGVNRFNRKTNTFTYYTTESGKNSILHDNVKTITYDESRDQIYIGTYTGGLSLYDRATNLFHNYLDDYKRTGKGPDHIIYYSLFKDGWLYVTARNGFWRMHPDKGEFHLISNKDIFQTFEIDSRGYVWLAADLDLYKLSLSDWGKIESVHFDTLENRKVRITKIMEAKDGTVYVSTIGNGVFSYNYDTGKWEHYTAEQNSLLSNFCYNLAESPLNNILITNDKGISIYSPFSHSMYSVELGAIKGMISAVADGGGICVADDDMVYIGGVDGVISFREKDLYINDESDTSELYFVSLFVNNVKVCPGDTQHVLEESLPFIQYIDLSSWQNNLMVDFSSSNYIELEKSIWYQYKLEGFDKDWISTNQLRLIYTNLAPGNYVLKVREAKNRLGEDMGEEIALNIVIHYPWYRSFWAYLVYFLIVAGIIYVFLRVRNARKALALSLAKEKDEKERIEEVNKMKLRFFTNISHEFRTPLTLIVGQIEMLLQSEKLSLSVYRRLHSIHKNAMNLRFLITELLDFRKQEQGFMKLKVECVDIVPFLEDVYRSFWELARKRNIVYTFEHPNEKMEVWFDPVQMQKAVFNLLSNAFKYTSDGKSVKVSVRKQQQIMEITVSDTGCGIPQDDLSRIFERFYQGNEKQQRGIAGSGIGLALTKGIIEAHRGDIAVESVLEEGSSFKIQLLLGNNHFTKEELEHEKVTVPALDWEAIVYDEVEPLPEEESEESEMDAGQEKEESGKPRVLLVEDDEGVLDMLEGIFSSSYIVYKASNGQMGFELAQQLQPDLVVSDVMMPVMSGKEMCYKIKNSLELAYIPVVLLTAQSSIDYTIEGYMFGADDYITKPFNVKLLLARCNNLLRNRRLLLKKLTRTEAMIPQEAGGFTAADQKLLDTASEVIKRNFDNPDFDMNMLASELNMGRSKMFLRLKEVMGLTPNEFTMKLKLEEALRLLQEEPQYNISEISYRLGFTSPRYFSRCFKSFYGVAPLSYRKDSPREESQAEEDIQE